MGHHPSVSDAEDVTCLCRVISRRDGNEADEYVRHLDRQSLDAERWTEVWTCPGSGVRWIGDYPHAEMQGGGPRRLRTAAAVSREVWVALYYVEDLLPDDTEARVEASDLRHRLVIEYPGTDPVAR